MFWLPSLATEGGRAALPLKLLVHRAQGSSLFAEGSRTVSGERRQESWSHRDSCAFSGARICL